MKNQLSIILKQLRTERGLKQKDIANKLKISERTYSNYETGNREPDINTIMEIADFYRISIDILVGRYKIDDLNSNNKKIC